MWGAFFPSIPSVSFNEYKESDVSLDIVTKAVSTAASFREELKCES